MCRFRPLTTLFIEIAYPLVEHVRRPICNGASVKLLLNRDQEEAAEAPVERVVPTVVARFDQPAAGVRPTKPKVETRHFFVVNGLSLRSLHALLWWRLRVRRDGGRHVQGTSSNIWRESCSFVCVCSFRFLSMRLFVTFRIAIQFYYSC